MIKRIESEEEREKRRKRKNRIFIILMLLILVGSSAGFAFLSKPGSNSNQQQNTNVTNVGGSYALNYGTDTLYFSYPPDSTKDIKVDINYGINDYHTSPLYVVSDNDGVFSEIASTLGKYSQRAQPACYGKCDKNLPEKNCTENLIVWNESAQQRIYQEEKCVFITGDLRAVDAFLYKVFNIK